MTAGTRGQAGSVSGYPYVSLYQFFPRRVGNVPACPRVPAVHGYGVGRDQHIKEIKLEG